jgi:NurA-like 5'-3' nuclease
MMVEKNYQSLQEEVEDMRKLIQKLRVKYKQAQTEVSDLNREHNREKQELFQQTKESEKETVLYRMVIQMFAPKLSIGDLNTIVANSEYDNDSLSWKVVIPPSIQKKHRVKVVSNSRNSGDNQIENASTTQGKKRQSLANAVAKASVISVDSDTLHHSNSLPGSLKRGQLSKTTS